MKKDTNSTPNAASVPLTGKPVSKQEKQHAAIDEAYNPVRGEMAMWAAVITQALMDAGSQSRKPEAQHEKAKAIRWLLGNSDDFMVVCLNAGLDPDYVRGKAKTAIASGCNWRRGLEAQRADRASIAATRPTLEHKQHPIMARPSCPFSPSPLRLSVITPLFSSLPSSAPASWRGTTSPAPRWQIAV